MLLKIVYQATNEENPYLTRAPDVRKNFAYPVQSKFIIALGRAGEAIQTRRGKLICQLSPQLYEALLKHHHEDPAMFEDEDPDAVKFLFKWISGSDDLSVSVLADTLLEAFVFAERYGLEDFFMSHVYGVADSVYTECCKGIKFAGLREVQLVYGETKQGSPIRRFIVDSIVWDPCLSFDGDTFAYYYQIMRSCGGTETPSIPEFYNDLQAAFAERFGGSVASNNHPFQRSEKEIVDRYSYSVATNTPWTLDAAVRDSVVKDEHEDAQPGTFACSLVMR